MSDLDGFVRQLRDAIDAIDTDQSGTEREYNRLTTTADNICRTLADAEGGRRRLELLARSDTDERIRLWAANTVRQWDEESARAALESIVVAAGGEVARPMTMSLALNAPSGISKTAALSLLNGGHPERPIPPLTPPGGVHARIRSTDLDAAERVYNLAMNGGIDHAWDVAAKDFPHAASALGAAGALEAARAVEEGAHLLKELGESLPDAGTLKQLDAIDEVLANTDVMDYLERASAYEYD